MRLSLIVFFSELRILGLGPIKLTLDPFRFLRQHDESDQQKQNSLQPRQQYPGDPEDDKEPSEPKDQVTAKLC